ncbi:uncharacterized protein LOC111126924 [Crassostrea virginica]
MANSTSKASDCDFNSYHNGSTCVPCEIGYYGKNCSDRCAPGLYGFACSKLCRNCSQANCHHIFGCPSDDKSSTILYSSSVENSSTSLLTPNLKYSKTSPAIVTDGEVISTTPTSSSVPNILVLIAAIGGLIALFLLVLVIQTFVKLYMKRKEQVRATQKSSKVKLDQPEDTKEAIDDSLLTAGIVETNEHKHRKYYQLHKNSNSELTVPFQQIRNESNYEEIDENCFLSNSSDSNKSNTSYLEPKTSVTVPSSYIEVLDSGSSTETSHSKGRLTGSVNPNTNDSSAQYLDPVHYINLPASLNNCSPENNDESLLTIEVVESNEHKHSKYYQLHKNSNSELTVPYQQIRSEQKYQEIYENCASSNCSDSNKSNTSYLEPKTSVHIPSSYIEVLDSGSSAETSHSEGRLTGSVNPKKNDSSAHYIDPVQYINLPASLNNCSPKNNYESLLTAGVVESNEHKHRKYYQLHKNSNSELTVPYQQLRSEPKYQEIYENCVSSNSFDSNKSNTSYLEPKTSVHVPSSYIEVLDSGSSAETSHSKGRLTVTPLIVDLILTTMDQRAFLVRSASMARTVQIDVPLDSMVFCVPKNVATAQIVMLFMDAYQISQVQNCTVVMLNILVQICSHQGSNTLQPLQQLLQMVKTSAQLPPVVVVRIY